MRIQIVRLKATLVRSYCREKKVILLDYLIALLTGLDTQAGYAV